MSKIARWEKQEVLTCAREGWERPRPGSGSRSRSPTGAPCSSDLCPRCILEHNLSGEGRERQRGREREGRHEWTAPLAAEPDDGENRQKLSRAGPPPLLPKRPNLFSRSSAQRSGPTGYVVRAPLWSSRVEGRGFLWFTQALPNDRK